MQLFELNELNERGISSLRFSPDGRLLAVWSLGFVGVLDTNTGAGRALWTESDETFWDPLGVGFTPDSSGVIASHRPDASRGALIRIHDSGGGGVRWESARERIGSADVAHDGRWACTAVLRSPDDASEIVVWDLIARARGPVIGRHERQLYQLAVSPDDRWLAATDGTALLVWEIGADGLLGGLQRTIGPPKRGGSDLAVSAGGEYLAYRKSRDGDRNRLWVWNTRTGDGGEVGPADGGDRRALAFHPQRPLLAYSVSKDVVFWDPVTRTELTRYTWDIGWTGCVAFSPDGLRCAAAGRDKVVVWDVDV